MSNTPKKIYLCGPIMDVTSDESTDWRSRAKEKLSGKFVVLDPMRRNFRDREIDSANEIVDFDLQDVRDADILLVNYGKASIGTSMEVFYASHDLGKFVIAFSPCEYQDMSPWMVKHCTKILPNVQEALTYIDRHF
jgi:nucleoside 2-deoxyribosyltransferase